MASTVRSSSTTSTNADKPHYEDKKGMMFWVILTSFFLMWSFFYIVFQSFAPSCVWQGDSAYKTGDVCERRPPENSKCFVAALVLTVIVMLLLWLIVASMK